MSAVWSGLSLVRTQSQASDPTLFQTKADVRPRRLRAQGRVTTANLLRSSQPGAYKYDRVYKAGEAIDLSLRYCIDLIAEPQREKGCRPHGSQTTQTNLEIRNSDEWTTLDWNDRQQSTRFGRGSLILPAALCPLADFLRFTK